MTMTMSRRYDSIFVFLITTAAALLSSHDGGIVVIAAFSLVSSPVATSVAPTATFKSSSSLLQLPQRKHHLEYYYYHDAIPLTAAAAVARNGKSFLLLSKNEDQGDTDDDSNTNENNPYSDPNYPELEFVNYNDPEYRMDRGMGDDDYDIDLSNYSTFSSPLSDEETLAEIEAMREERRRKNDEYQFETYHSKVLRGGEVTLGEWTVFQTDTFMGKEILSGRSVETENVPRLLRWDKVLKVVSRGSKIVVADEKMLLRNNDDKIWMRVDGERIVHEERLATLDDFPSLMLRSEEEEVEELRWEEEERLHVDKNTYWPQEMTALDFRGAGGNMCVGKAYTICDALPLKGGKGMDDDEDKKDLTLRHAGPFSEMRTELGLQSDSMRFRVKLDYALLDEDEKSAIAASSPSPPPLHLRTLTICRETLDGYWPDPADNEGAGSDDDNNNSVRRKNQEAITAALFGPSGAPGGLYDPPPVGSEERAVDNYMLLDFEGGATVLLPHRLDQSTDDDDLGWVTSLDWTPGKIRYQVDRKVLGGIKLKGLKTLELSEVQGEDADTWRPRDGGANMRQ